MDTQLRSILVEGRLWHDKNYGNTYHAVQLHANGLLIGTIGMTYGYEDQYTQTALAWLKAQKLVDEEASSLVALRTVSTDVYTTRADVLKKELWTNWVNEAGISKIKEGRI
jgi:hypothetical protein